MHLQEIDLGKAKTTVMWDTGANCSLMTFSLARKLKLLGTQKRLMMTLASKKTEEIDTKVFQYKLTSKTGESRVIDFIGVREIANQPESVDVSAAYNLFPQLSPGDVNRPKLPIGLLCGQDCSIFLPVGGESYNQERVGDLRLMRTGFGSGYLLGGFHDDIKTAPLHYSDDAMHWRSAAAVSNIPANATINTVRVSVLPACYEDDDIDQLR